MYDIDQKDIFYCDLVDMFTNMSIDRTIFAYVRVVDKPAIFDMRLTATNQCSLGAYLQSINLPQK